MAFDGSGRLLLRTAAAALLAAALALTILRTAEGGVRHNVVLRYAASAPGTAETPAAQTEAPAEMAVYHMTSRDITVSVGGEAKQMELEDYLVGVVAAEMEASAPEAALMAQAVAARTFTALHMEGGAKCKSGCTVCSDTNCCQAYKTEEQLRKFWGSEYERNIAAVRRAVKVTEGVVLLYEGRLISALYHASSGPATEDSEAVFAMALPYLVSVSSNEGERQMTSRREFAQKELAEKLDTLYSDAHLSPPLTEEDIVVWGRTDSGRVQLVQIGDTVITGQQMRNALGLASTEFTVEFSGDTVCFTCIGYGHGVGMSQCGAMEMASEGASYDEILLHYYSGTELAHIEYGGSIFGA